MMLLYPGSLAALPHPALAPTRGPATSPRVLCQPGRLYERLQDADFHARSPVPLSPLPVVDLQPPTHNDSSHQVAHFGMGPPKIGHLQPMEGP